MAEAKQGIYEAMFLLGASASADLEAGINLCRQTVERHEGTIVVIKKWDERKLAYEIEGNKRGTYVICYYRGPGRSVAAIDRDVNLSEQILRVMITRADHLTEEQMHAVEPQPIQQREERGGYGDRPERFERSDRGDRGDRGEDRPPRAPRPRREEPAEAEKE